MSSIWTPDGERPVAPQRSDPPSAKPETAPTGRRPAGFGEEAPGSTAGANDPRVAEMEDLRRQLADAPASMVVANHCFGLFELAALHLSTEPPKLSEAQLAIDALAALVESLTGRLGDPEAQLRDGLSQLRVAFVQIKQKASAAGNN